MNRRTHRHMKDNGQTALSRQTDVAIFALPIIVPSEEVCDARDDAMKYQKQGLKNYNFFSMI